MLPLLIGVSNTKLVFTWKVPWLTQWLSLWSPCFTNPLFVTLQRSKSSPTNLTAEKNSSNELKKKSGPAEPLCKEWASWGGKAGRLHNGGVKRGLKNIVWGKTHLSSHPESRPPERLFSWPISLPHPWHNTGFELMSACQKRRKSSSQATFPQGSHRI